MKEVNKIIAGVDNVMVVDTGIGNFIESDF